MTQQQHQPSGPSRALYEVRETRGRGKGVFALVDLAPGDLIMSEAPFFSYKAGMTRGQLIAAVNRMSKAQRSIYNSFGKSIGLSVEGIALTNGLPMPEQGKVGMFEHVCRLNHACRPNAQYFWNDELQREVVHCVRPIAAGKEVLVSYTTTLENVSRRAELEEDFGFVCQCALCDTKEPHRSRSDARWSELAGIFGNAVTEAVDDEDDEVSDDEAEGADAGGGNDVRAAAASCLASIERALAIIDEEDAPVSLKPRLCFAAFAALARSSDEQGARAWAARAAEGYRITKGDMRATRRMLELSKDPRLWKSFGRCKTVA